MQQSNSQHNLNFIFSSPMSSFVHPQPTSFPPAQPDDPNSPVLFKHNINLVQTQISTVRSLAHEALNAMCVLHSPRLNSELSTSSSFLQLIERSAYYSAKAPTSADRAPHMQLVMSIPSLPYFESLLIGDFLRKPCCVKAMS
jgi:hypothetical protein